MSEVAPADGRPAFSPRVILALVLVSLFSLSALTVLSAYAPDLRTGSDGGAHALSNSAVGFAGAIVMLKAEGVPTIISRSPPTASQMTQGPLLVLTPGLETSDQDLARFVGDRPTLIVLPKWIAAPDQRHDGWVTKVGSNDNDRLPLFAKSGPGADTRLQHRSGVAHPRLHAVGGPFAAGAAFDLGRIDRLQTISGSRLTPVLLDEAGRTVLAATRQRGTYVLADPDLLNTQGLADLENARAGMAIVNALRGDGGVGFDVTLNGFQRARSLLRLMLEPPLLGATLCGVAAAILAGLHALGRFGPPLRRGRAYALGQSALVDNSAGLIRMSRKEAQLAPAYAEQTQALAARAVGAGAVGAGEARTERLARLGKLRRLDVDLDQLVREAGQAKTRADLLACARRLYQWRLEITRERG